MRLNKTILNLKFSDFHTRISLLHIIELWGGEGDGSHGSFLHGQVECRLVYARQIFSRLNQRRHTHDIYYRPGAQDSKLYLLSWNLPMMILNVQVQDINDKTKYVPMPPNQETVNMLFNEKISSKEEMVTWLTKRRPQNPKGNLCYYLLIYWSWFLPREIVKVSFIKKENLIQKKAWTFSSFFGIKHFYNQRFPLRIISNIIVELFRL